MNSKLDRLSITITRTRRKSNVPWHSGATITSGSLVVSPTPTRLIQSLQPAGRYWTGTTSDRHATIQLDQFISDSYCVTPGLR